MRVEVNAEQLMYRSPGGIGRYTAQLLSVLPALYPDLDMAAFTARHPVADIEEALAEAGVGAEIRARVAVQPWPRPLMYESWVRLGRPALRGLSRPDLIHAPSVAVPPPGGVPMVVTVHDAAPALFPEAFPPRGRRFHDHGLRAASRRADLVITVSAAAAGEIVAHSRIPEERIRIVPNGVSRRDVGPHLVRGALEARGLADRPYVLWVGSLEPRKGVGTLVAAMSLLRQARSVRVDTVLAGYEGWLGGGPVDPADRAVLGDSLHELGRVHEEELSCLYAGATVFAFPSLHEGFGLPVVEAMSHGTAVVASDIPALREVAGGAAVLVEPGAADKWAEALGDLLEDARAREGIAESGRERSRCFGVERMAAGTRAVYDEVGTG